MAYDQEIEADLRQKQSGLGIASFVVAVLSGMTAVALVVVAGVLEANTPGGIDDESPASLIVGFGVLAIIGLNMLGLGLGVAAFFQADRLRIFPILGVMFNAMVILGLCGLIVIGLTVAG